MNAREPDTSLLKTFRQAVEEGLADQVEELLEKGIDPNVDFGGGVRPLHIAAQQGQAGMVLLLLAKGADLNSTTRAGWTVLHVVALTGDHEIADLLLQHGATADRPNDQGHIPADLAKANNRQEVLALLNKAAKKPWQFWK